MKGQVSAMPENLRKPVILTVDDDPIILNAVLETLKNDYAVRPFTSGDAALLYLENDSADLIILDHNMPNLTGLEVLKILHENPKTKEIPVIFLTGSVSSEDEVHALEIGAMDYLLKPFKPSSLLTRVRLQLELDSHRHHLEELVEKKTAELLLVNQKLEQRDKITLDLLAKASDMRDHKTGDHIERVVLFTKVIVDDLVQNPMEGYEISEQYGSDIVEAVRLHDLGKLAMPDRILLKPGRLSEKEFDIMKMHPIFGAKMLDQAIGKMGEDSLLVAAFEIIYNHHEKWDGTGYTNGLKGTEIPLSARIAAVADVFEALTSIRPYKHAWSTDRAFEELFNAAGSHFDPYLIEVVKHKKDEFTQIAKSNYGVEGLPVVPELLAVPEFEFIYTPEYVSEKRKEYEATNILRLRETKNH